MIEHVTGVILAGGKSTRMGKNKALLPYQGKLMIESLLEKFSEIFTRIVVSVNQNETFPQLHFPKVVDRYHEKGPLGGITSVLETGEARIFCAACDMPYLSRRLIEYLCGLSGSDAVIPVWNQRPEVLHAVYSKSLLPSFQSSLRQERLRIIDALGEADVRYVQDEEIQRFDPEGLSFRNINTPSEYKDI